MKLRDIVQELDATTLNGEDRLNNEITRCGASDLMSDVLARPTDGTLLMTGLTTIQTIRTAKIAGVVAVVFVRGKRPPPEVVTVDVRQADGSVVPSNHTFWMTQFGPVLVPAAAAAWSPVRAYALTDINLENARAFRQYREMGTARDLNEFAAVLRRHAGLPWVNTIAADSAGNAFYGDIGSMPNASNAKLAACIKPGVSAALAAARAEADERLARARAEADELLTHARTEAVRADAIATIRSACGIGIAVAPSRPSA